MTAQDYILNRLAGLQEAVPQPAAPDDSDEELFQQTYARLMSKKFRKLKATEACKKDVTRAIRLSIKNKSPIVISTLFGGNKLWRFEEAPDIDWAELFNIFYYVDWMKTVLEVYPYGATIDYYSQDISVESLNNVPRNQTDSYSQTFRALIEWLQPYLPAGITITYRRHFEEFDDPADYYKELEAGKKIVLEQNNGELPSLTAAMAAATELNVKLRPGQVKDPKWREKVELEHQAIFQTPTLGKYLNHPGAISLCPTDYQDSNSIITGSTKRSYAKFWAAIGALQKDGETYNELVLTPKQLATAHFVWETVDIHGLPSKNFRRIRIIS
jgi:hypothetical protein